MRISVKTTQAQLFAIRAHGEQKRKYTGGPYYEHPFAVATIVDYISGGDEGMICAALLHDVVEDTKYTLENIEERFGEAVADLVMWLTDVSEPHHGNRKFRKEMDRNHIASAPPSAKTIKIADMIDNSRSICEHDKDFAVVYMAEKRLLLDVLKDGDRLLWLWAKSIVDDYYATL